jgi:hypothetical protein
MEFHVSNKLIVTAVMFAVAFVLVTFIFFRKPHIARSKNRLVRAAAIFCIAFVPGVLAATVCAKALTEICTHVFSDVAQTVAEEIVDDDNEEEKHAA